jgi:hypothetical protein
MSQPDTFDVSHQVPRTGGTYSATAPQAGGNCLVVTASCTLEVFQQNVHVASAATVTLPAVGAATGRVFVFTIAANTTIQDQNDAYSWADITAVAGQSWLLVSNGFGWVQLLAVDTSA